MCLWGDPGTEIIECIYDVLNKASSGALLRIRYFKGERNENYRKAVN